MLLKINLNIKCKFCGNSDDAQFYVMPVEKEVLDGKYFSNNTFKIVCKKCKTKQVITWNLEKEI